MENNMDEVIKDATPYDKAVTANRRIELAISTALLKRIKALAVGTDPLDHDQVKALGALGNAYRDSKFY